jgi:hypothetical protein
MTTTAFLYALHGFWKGINSTKVPGILKEEPKIH